MSLADDDDDNNDDDDPVFSIPVPILIPIPIALPFLVSSSPKEDKEASRLFLQGRGRLRDRPAVATVIEVRKSVTTPGTISDDVAATEVVVDVDIVRYGLR